jgi:DNA-binding MarR family transcriptional regulator
MEMASVAPKTPFEVRRRALLGFRQQQVLGFMRGRDQPPSLREIAEALGLDGKGHAFNIVARLEKRGEICRDSDGRRKLAG